MSIRILLADDHELFTTGLRALLMVQPDMEVVGLVTDGLETVRKAKEVHPDLLITDISMPGSNGIEATREIRDQSPEIKVLILSMHAEPSFVCAALDAGASGYLVKECALDELIRAIRAIVANHVYLSPSIAGAVVQAMKNRATSARPTAFQALTDRERGVLQLIAEGHSTKAIASRLHLSVKTIGTHREHIQHKLEIDSIAGLTKYAIREGLTSTAG